MIHGLLSFKRRYVSIPTKVERSVNIKAPWREINLAFPGQIRPFGRCIRDFSLSFYKKEMSAVLPNLNPVHEKQNISVFRDLFFVLHL
jgi:hypothetical protein